jgi:hypothetical protein
VVETPVRTEIAFPGDDRPALRQYRLSDFWSMPHEQRADVLIDAVLRTHAWHYLRNRSYRVTVSARGIGPVAGRADLARLLRSTAQTFKSYIDLLGSPFPQDQPLAFLEWLTDQLSIDLPGERFARFRDAYGSLEGLLADFERIYADLGLEILTSSGSSGRSTILVRDRDAIDRTTESFYLCFQRYFHMQAGHRAIFFMPAATRIAMARMAAFSVTRVWAGDPRIHLTIPFPAYPDEVRVRAGRAYRPGLHGTVERRVLHPFITWMNDRCVTPWAVRKTISLLERSAAEGEKVLLFGGLVQLHAVALELVRRGRVLSLAPGSLLGTGGGLKELYETSPADIRRALRKTFKLDAAANGANALGSTCPCAGGAADQRLSCDGAETREIPIVDTYGMAEANWAAMQCTAGNYHLPPWLYAVTLDDDDNIQEEQDSTGRLAFFDPYGGGNLFPPFFKTPDRVHLVCGHLPGWRCSCGDPSSYLVSESIRRVDLLDEAGCAAQV